jgi:hypothetical protein
MFRHYLQVICTATKTTARQDTLLLGWPCQRPHSPCSCAHELSMQLLQDDPTVQCHAQVVHVLSTGCKAMSTCVSSSTTTMQLQLSKRLQSMCPFACEHQELRTAFMMQHREAVICTTCSHATVLAARQCKGQVCMSAGEPCCKITIQGCSEQVRICM